MVRIMSIGAAVQDVFLRGKIFEPNKEADGSLTEEFALGTKNEVDAITHSTGGGATNASVTFARAGLKSMFLGRVGQDVAGRAVLESLRKDGVDTTHVKMAKDGGTGYSTILLSPDGERTILTYRGVSKHYELKNSDFYNTSPDWFYISSLSGDIEALKTIVDYAKTNDIKIAINPGRGELKHKNFKDLLESFDILSLNKEEMKELFTGDKPEELLKNACKKVKSALLTDGPNGSFASDGKKMFSAGMYDDVVVIDRLGAGDAFTSGYVCMISQGKSVQEALTYASANSTSVVQKIGAKDGIIDEGFRLHAMDIKEKEL